LRRIAWCLSIGTQLFGLRLPRSSPHLRFGNQPVTIKLSDPAFGDSKFSGNVDAGTPGFAFLGNSVDFFWVQFPPTIRLSRKLFGLLAPSLKRA
jgi:hypothetical protein